jgi:hypothetical protein
MTIYKIPSGYSSYNLPIGSVSNQNDSRSAHQQAEIPREHNQKDATATTQTTNCVQDIPLFR